MRNWSSIMLGILLFLFAFTGELSAYNSCPPQNTGSFCSCNSGILVEAPVTVLCSDIKDPSTLLKEIQSLRGYKIDILILNRLQLPYLPPALFLGTSVEVLYVSHSTLDNLYSTKNYSPSPFAGLEDSLKALHIYSTQEPAKWYWPDLRGLKKLKTIEIYMSPIDFVGHHFAEIGGGSLESITVVDSRVYRLHPQAFPELTNLKRVNFRGNRLPYMVRTMFPNPAPQLKEINLRNNKLFTLPDNMFDNMPALEYLDLSQNEFKIYKDLPAYNSLTTFFISKNPFECNCELLPLKQKLKASTSIKHDLYNVTCRDPGSKNYKFISQETFDC